ncbi:MurR/RpiR family transcriptional regulator (plasmid) [Rhizobium grahamii]|uniref:MurR/RpiR family transcriptional regulator n=1 Tax=Rhizobium grahamii TaxID=1120045 RepID=A0A5Q0CFK9_9HYPH|nr:MULTISPECIES: MurR/RpiR family transcriptional regulator [Rhizobium]QFY64113.1 MurR/RpiR family transcriptional regulator [Rhizobium grahamii]QRM53016.1 MurR/RpiR family transcriptional regulator [Rhizobium sp. BG6]
MPRTKETTEPPVQLAHYEGFVNEVTKQYDSLSDRFQQVARFITQNPNIVAMQSINVIAEQCGAHPSILVRFAQHFGFSGFKQLQAVFQTRLSTAAPGYRERISALDADLEKTKKNGNLGFLHDLVVRDIATLQGLLNTVSEENLTQAATVLNDADTIFIVGQLRSEPIARFLRYVLSMLRRRVVLLDPAGGLAPEMAQVMGPKDVLVAISFRHYAKEVIAIADVAAQNGTPMVAITDSQLSPLAKGAAVLFTVPEDEYSFSRSLAAPMCLTQCIAVSLAAMLQTNGKDAPRIPTVTGNLRRKP